MFASSTYAAMNMDYIIFSLSYLVYHTNEQKPLEHAKLLQSLVEPSGNQPLPGYEQQSSFTT